MKNGLAIMTLVALTAFSAEYHRYFTGEAAEPAAMSTRNAHKEKCISCKPAISRMMILKAPNGATIKAANVLDSISLSTEMVLVKGGTFQMGSNQFDDAMPVHAVTIKSFYMDVHEVTNAAFARFVRATNYLTIAERRLDLPDNPNTSEKEATSGSAVFTPPDKAVSLDNPAHWWSYVAGANWKHPRGQNSNIIGKDKYPVVQIAYPDAVAYATWAGKRLPTEAEWEYAARAGKHYENYYWGNQLKPSGKWMTNIFQGSFPYHNTNEDGYTGVAAVKSFPPNAYGIYDLEGNVWEWCSDLYRPDYYENSPTTDPNGPATSYDPDEPNTEKHVQRGGSFLCSDQYCNRYKAGARGQGETNSAGNNLGFRCVKDAKIN